MMKYNKKPIDAETVKQLSAKYNINILLSSILARRGITKPEDIMFFLEEDLKFIHNPFLFNEMEDAVDRIRAARDEGEKVIVFGDRDADGISSTVLVVKKLKEMGIDVAWSLPSGDDPYGFTEEKVRSFAETGGTLIITVDCGISSVKEISFANDLGIDTIIIDHHMPGETMPDAFAVINPKVEDSGYPFRDLAGCGVAAKVIWALSFSETDFYKKEICLLNIIPGSGGSFIAEAQRIFNLVSSREPVREVFVPGIINDPSETALVRYMRDSIIAVYSAPLQKRLFSEIFGQGVELNAFDIAVQVAELFPRFKGMSLLKMREISRDARYSGKPITELDILGNLFNAVVLRQNRSLNENLEGIMDFVTIGSIADMMPLVNKNRIIVRHGLKNIQKTENMGLHELLFRQKLLEKNISTSDIAWNITPLINATGRMGVPEKAAELFFSDDIEEVKKLADEIISLNKERKKLGDSLWDLLFNSAKKSFEEMDKSLVVAGGEKVNRGITGVLSARFASYFSVPAVIYTILDDRIVGSVRSMRNYPIMDMMNYCSDLFIDFGGHDFAGGFSLEAGNLERLKKRLIDFAKKNTTTTDSEKVIDIDAELPEGFLNQDVVDAANAMMPFGEGNPNLVFLARSLTVKSMEIMGNRASGHLKMVLDSAGTPWPAVFWNASERAGKDVSVDDKVDVIFKIRNNFFANNNIPQLDIIDIERCG